LWDIRPGRFSGPRFDVFTGDATRRPRVLLEGEVLTPADETYRLSVPVEYRDSFDTDILAALRDIAGVSTLALHPFIMDTQAVVDSFGIVKSVLSSESCDFKDQIIQIYPKRFTNLQFPRFMHGDMGLTGDSFGFAIGHVPGFKTIRRGHEVEIMPIIQYDCLLEIRPPRGGEIEFDHVRRLMYRLRDLGLPIKWATFDSFQSTDTIQMLRQRGFITGLLSMDTDTLAYDVTKQALYDRRIVAPEHAKAQGEIVRLERDPKTKKIDHPARGSKDVSDAMAGVCYGLTMRRDVWRQHGIPITSIPRGLLKAEDKSRGSLNQTENRQPTHPGLRA